MLLLFLDLFLNRGRDSYRSGLRLNNRGNLVYVVFGLPGDNGR